MCPGLFSELTPEESDDAKSLPDYCGFLTLMGGFFSRIFHPFSSLFVSFVRNVREASLPDYCGFRAERCSELSRTVLTVIPAVSHRYCSSLPDYSGFLSHSPLPFPLSSDQNGE